MTNPAYVAYDNLTREQQRIHDDVQERAAYNGRDLRDVLLEVRAMPEDKAAVADVFGGPGAGAEFLNGTAR